MNSWAKRLVLITGASSGLGAEFARQMASQAKGLILVARRKDRLEQLKEELKAIHPSLHIWVRSDDLAQEGEVETLVEWLSHQELMPEILINNAGFGDIGTFVSADWNKLRAMLQVNLVALTELTHRLLPSMLEKKEGIVLQVASTAGFLPLPMMGIYAATKAFVCNFSEALHAELIGTGVTVTSLCPGPVITEFGEVAAREGQQRAFSPSSFLLVSPQQVVREALQAACLGKARVIPGIRVRLGAWILETIPTPWLRPLLTRASHAVSVSKK